MTKPTVVFDLDGTLADTMGVLTFLAVRTIVREYGTSVYNAYTMYRGTIGRSFADQLDMIFPDTPWNKSVASMFNGEKRDEWLNCPLQPRARETVAVLKDAGYQVYVASSTELSLVSRYLRNNGLELTVLPGVNKAEQLSSAADAQRALFVGDAPYDAEVARQEGLSFIGVEHTFSRDAFGDVQAKSIPTLWSLVYELA